MGAKDRPGQSKKGRHSLKAPYIAHTNILFLFDRKLQQQQCGPTDSNHKVEGSILRKWPKDTGTAGREGEREKGEHFNTEQDERGAGLVVQRLWPTRCPD